MHMRSRGPPAACTCAVEGVGSAWVGPTSAAAAHACPASGFEEAHPQLEHSDGAHKGGMRTGSASGHASMRASRCSTKLTLEKACWWRGKPFHKVRHALQQQRLIWRGTAAVQRTRASACPFHKVRHGRCTAHKGLCLPLPQSTPRPLCSAPGPACPFPFRGTHMPIP